MAKLIQKINLQVVFPLVVVWALFAIFFGDGKKCGCVFVDSVNETSYCRFATEACRRIPSQIVNGSVARNFVIDKFFTKNESALNDSDTVPKVGPYGTTSPKQFHLYDNEDQPIYYVPLLLSAILMCQAALMFLHKLCLKSGKSDLVVSLSEQLNRPQLSMEEKQRIFFEDRTAFSHHGYIIWLKGIIAVAIVFVELAIMKGYTGEGISQCFNSWGNSFELDIQRWGRNDSFYQQFPGIVDCRVQALINYNFNLYRTDDPYDFDTLCHIPRNESYEFWYRALYSWTVIVACIMVLDQFLKVVTLNSSAVRARIFTVRFKSLLVWEILTTRKFPKNISASEIWFLDDLQYAIPETDFNTLIASYLESAIERERYNLK
ncbi:hypothetical protein Ocin01_05293 [Orchesella cincta]|uniref:Innexin n=1 Tax=Orchesella cincta TaxID=48709 RepID=A0A1D2N7Z1_ORCCI|nr:hypothetical protein Ocin01_05293 [Orchesella cincta]